MVDEDSLVNVAKITPEIVQQAAHSKLKSGKSDPVFSSLQTISRMEPSHCIRTFP